MSKLDGRDRLHLSEGDRAEHMRDVISQHVLRVTLQELHGMWSDRHYLRALLDHAESEKLPPDVVDEIKSDLQDPNRAAAEMYTWHRRLRAGQTPVQIAEALRYLSHDLIRNEAFELFCVEVAKLEKEKQGAVLNVARKAINGRAFFEERKEYIHRLDLMIQEADDTK